MDRQSDFCQMRSAQCLHNQRRQSMTRTYRMAKERLDALHPCSPWPHIHFIVMISNPLQSNGETISTPRHWRRCCAPHLSSKALQIYLTAPHWHWKQASKMSPLPGHLHHHLNCLVNCSNLWMAESLLENLTNNAIGILCKEHWMVSRPQVKS